MNEVMGSNPGSEVIMLWQHQTQKPHDYLKFSLKWILRQKTSLSKRSIKIKELVKNMTFGIY